MSFLRAAKTKVDKCEDVSFLCSETRLVAQYVACAWPPPQFALTEITVLCWNKKVVFAAR